MEERRKHPRIAKHAPLTVQVLSYQENIQQEVTEYADMGGGGLRFISSIGYEQGTLLKIQAKVPGWGSFANGLRTFEDGETRRLVAVAEVVRSRPLPENGRHDVGVKFVNLYENDHRALLEYIRSMIQNLE